MNPPFAYSPAIKTSPHLLSDSEIRDVRSIALAKCRKAQRSRKPAPTFFLLSNSPQTHSPPSYLLLLKRPASKKGSKRSRKWNRRSHLHSLRSILPISHT